MAQEKKHPYYSHTDKEKVQVKNEEWKTVLNAELYHIAREQGTERPFSSSLEKCFEKGTYFCATCGAPLFKSDAKFESSCGWPSFFEPITKKSIIYEKDYSLSRVRTEIKCARCNSHLGHVFEDGPPPTHLRYCLNGISLDFENQ